MGYESSFLVPVGRMTLTDQKSYVARAIAKGVDRLILPAPMGLGLCTSEDEVSVRAVRAFADWGVGTILQDEWRFNLAAGNNAGAVTVVARPANQITVIYGMDNFDTVPVVDLVTWRTALVGGTTKLMVDAQITRGYMESGGFFSQPVVYDPQRNIFADIEADAASATQLCMFWAFIIEPRGDVLS